MAVCIMREYMCIESYDMRCETKFFRRENSVLSYKIGLKLNIFEELLLWNCLWVLFVSFRLVLAF